MKELIVTSHNDLYDVVELDREDIDVVWKIKIPNVKECMDVIGFLSKNNIDFRSIEDSIDEFIVDPSGLDEEAFKENLIVNGNASEIDFEVYDLNKFLSDISEAKISSEKLTKERNKIAEKKELVFDDCGNSFWKRKSKSGIAFDKI